MAKKSSSGFPPEATESTATNKRKNVLETTEAEPVKNKKSRFEIDPSKKLQCSLILKIMAHRYGWAFTHPKPTGLGFDAKVRKPMDLNSIKWKLEKGLYRGTDEFAGDVYEMLGDATTRYHPDNEIRKTANKFKRDFEMKWNTLKQRWETEMAEKKKKEKEKEKEIEVTNKSEPSTKFCLKIKLKLPPSYTANGELKKKPISGISYVAQGNGKPKKHFLDTVMAAQANLLDFGRKAEVERKKKEREAARVATETVEAAVPNDDNLKSFQELELLCGHSLSYPSSNALQSLGLFLKDEWMNHLDEDEFLNGNWEEGEIIY